MKKAMRFGLGLAAAALLVGGCEEQASDSPARRGHVAGEEAQSVLGKAADAAGDVADGIQDRSQEAADAADDFARDVDRRARPEGE